MKNRSPRRLDFTIPRGHIDIMKMVDGCMIPCFYRKVMIHKKPLLCSTGTGPVPITDQRRHKMKWKAGGREEESLECHPVKAP